MSKCVESWALSITPSILSFPILPLFHPHAVFLACFFIWTSADLWGTESVASILSRLDVMCGLSSVQMPYCCALPLCDCIALFEEAMRVFLNHWPYLLFIILSPGVRPLHWRREGARLSSCHCFEAASSLEQVSVGRAKDWVRVKGYSGSSSIE